MERADVPPRTKITQLSNGMWRVEASLQAIDNSRTWFDVIVKEFRWTARRAARRWLNNQKPRADRVELVGLPGEPTCICVGPRPVPVLVKYGHGPFYHCDKCGGTFV